MKTIFKKTIIIILICFAFPTYAQEMQDSFQGTWRGEVLEVVSEETKNIPGTNTDHVYQTIRFKALDGPKAGTYITIENDYVELSKGNTFFFDYNVYADGSETYNVVELDRKVPLIILSIIFIGVITLFGRWQGFCSLVSLIVSFVALFYILLPAILAGWSPLGVSILVASTILFVAIFFTHGFNKESCIAYGGTMVAVIITGLFAMFSVYITHLTGFSDEATTYLNFHTDGSLDFTALLLGAIIIGVLGILDDIAITQVAVVSELYESNPRMDRKEAYKRALRVGRDHVGALVNTLVLAYTGASLPLLLFLYTSQSSMSIILSTEIVATEIVRTIVGSVGLVLTVPIVTLLAVFYLKTEKNIN